MEKKVMGFFGMINRNNNLQMKPQSIKYVCVFLIRMGIFTYFGKKSVFYCIVMRRVLLLCLYYIIPLILIVIFVYFFHHSSATKPR